MDAGSEIRGGWSDEMKDHSTRLLRVLLIAGFGGLLAIMLIAGFTALRTLGELHRAEEEARREYLKKNQALNTVNLVVHSYTDQVEQYLLNNPPVAAAPTFETQVDQLFRDANAALLQYPVSGDPMELSLLAEMKSQLRDQEKTFRSVLAMPPQDRQRQERNALNRDLISGRLQLLNATQQVAALNRQRQEETDSQLFAKFGHLRMRVTWMLLLGLAAGLLLSLLCGVYIMRLERQARRRYEQIVRSQQDLERLSARLVDAQEAERRALSRELHDEVGQSLGALLMDVSRLKSQLSGSANLRDELDHIRNVAEKTVATVRNMSLLLRPSMLDDLGLVPAVEWQGREVSRRSQLEVEVHATDIPDDLPDDYKICIYRVVQEALNNAARHASAHHARVELKQGLRLIEVSISDDGSGFDAERVRGMGLLGMEERVRRLKGTLVIESKPGQGTEIRVQLPTSAGYAQEHAEIANTARG
jgi:signal transduction histidine kinase